MKKSLAKNPNMLRTMIGTGLVLVLILSYAVYSNTLDSEYYGYNTTNESETINLQSNEEGQANWYFTSKEAITWINVTIEGVGAESSTLIIEASGVEWYYSSLLGIEGADFFNCEDGGFSEVSESCLRASVHEIPIDNEGEQIIHGRVSLNLPIEGLGYIQSDNTALAEEEARNIIDNEKKTVTWNLKVVNNGGVISDDNITISTSIVKHEFVSIEEFKLNPVQESIYSLATLIGCFFLLLFVPLTIYFSALYKSKNDDKLRLEK
ncbi:MAG: hypothetical protein ACJZ4F_04875 [Candidatus Thalassarchaeaceae archaeon]|tara:strand:- start:38550 stop:39344 length:795 start_codon:yes stop_codon:yes gene_type:complete